MSARDNSTNRDDTTQTTRRRWRGRVAALGLVVALTSTGGHATPMASAEEPQPLPTWASCTVPFPESWQASLDAAPQVEPGQEMLPLQDEGFVRATKDAVYWEVPGDQPRLLHSSDTDIDKPVTDGRHVVFRVGNDLLTWDSKHPDQPVRSVTTMDRERVTIPIDTSFHDISEGQLWYRDAEDTSEGGVQLFHADLDRGESLYPAHVFANAWFGAAYRGNLQYTRGYGVWLARPFWSSSMFWGPIDHAMVVNHSESVHLLSARLWGLDEAWLWDSSTGETIELGVADTMAGDWVAVGSGRLYNHRAKAMVQLPDGMTPELAGQGTAAHLWLTRSEESGTGEATIERRVLRLTELAEVTCQP